MTLAAITELEAVNELLATIGEAPVATLSGTLPIDAYRALERLTSRSRSLQTEGWAFNTDPEVLLQRAVDGTIPVPNDALSVDVLDLNLRMSVMDGKLYDRINRTFSIATPVLARIIYLYPFERLPQYAREYIMVSAGRQFQDMTLGDDSLHRFTKTDETQAWARFLAADALQGDYNVVRQSPVTMRLRRRLRVP